MNTSVPAVPQSEELVTPELTEEAKGSNSGYLVTLLLWLLKMIPGQLDKITPSFTRKKRHSRTGRR